MTGSRYGRHELAPLDNGCCETVTLLRFILFFSSSGSRYHELFTPEKKMARAADVGEEIGIMRKE